MRFCESEENRRKLAWLVPGYILLAWFFCVVFQPLGLTSVPGHGNNNDYNDESLYEIINLQDDPQVADENPFNLEKLMILFSVDYSLRIRAKAEDHPRPRSTKWPYCETDTSGVLPVQGVQLQSRGCCRTWY